LLSLVKDQVKHCKRPPRTMLKNTLEERQCIKKCSGKDKSDVERHCGRPRTVNGVIVAVTYDWKHAGWKKINL